MFSYKCIALCSRSLIAKRHIHSSLSCMKKFEHPLKRTIRILKNDLRMIFPAKEKEKREESLTIFPNHVDVVIVGGGAIGSSIAYFLKEKSGPEGLKVLIIEKDPSYRESSTVLSVGGLRQQFSLPENIEMSLFGAEFLRTMKRRFGPEANVYFHPNGYLMLAGEEGAEILLDNSKMQNELGARNIILNKHGLKERFPWMETDDIALGCLGIEKEGWFDPWAFLNAVRNGACDMGAEYLNAEVVDFVFETRQEIVVENHESAYEGTNELLVKLPNGEEKWIHFAYCVIAGGAESGEIAKMVKVGTGPGMLTVPLPVEKRKRYVYCFDCQSEGPGLSTPLTVDYSGAYFRREGLGNRFICGLSPQPEEEPSTDNLDVDYKYFDDKVWPLLANRVPSFNNIKIRSGWGGYYDFNMYDENGIVGLHPYYSNILFATGFSGHGIQQSPAVGRAIAELILDGQFMTIDLTRFGFERLIYQKPMFEVCIV